MVGALEPHFARAFGDRLVLREWFSTVLLYSEVATLPGPYSDFVAIGGACRIRFAKSLIAAIRLRSPMLQ